MVAVRFEPVASFDDDGRVRGLQGGGHGVDGVDVLAMSKVGDPIEVLRSNGEWQLANVESLANNPRVPRATNIAAWLADDAGGFSRC